MWQCTIFLEPLLCDHASIADDADTGQLELLFTVVDQAPQELALIRQERLPSREVDLLHTYNTNRRH